MREKPILPRFWPQRLDAAAGGKAQQDDSEDEDRVEPGFVAGAFGDGGAEVVVVDVVGSEGMVAGAAGKEFAEGVRGHIVL